MQVSHLSDLDTHAVIGGGEAKPFGIAETAEFFTVLSDTLYRDKHRAVVREVICNAWDAHMMVGRPDLPVEVTLTDAELQIRDCGPGIPDDKIGSIYCVYGNTTKIDDDNQIGGFGLGCKAPFAYTHHFTVTNCNGGYRSVYAISRGSSETGGRPDYRQMVRVPTQETGITVTIPIRSEADRKSFDKNIREVAYFGGKPVRLNGEPLPSLDYTEARKSGFLIVPKSEALPEAFIYVLIGAVLYPVSSSDDAIHDMIREVGQYGRDNRMILIAKPNELAITPSREALSYTDRTIRALREMFQRVKRSIDHHLPDANRIAIARALDQNIKEPFDISEELFYKIPYTTRIEKPIADPREVAVRLALFRLPFTDRCNTFRILGREAGRRWPEHRRFFRRHLRGYRFNKTAINNYSARLFVRLALKTGLTDQLYFRRTLWRNSPGYGLHKMGSCELPGPAMPVLVVGHSKRSAVDHVKANWEWDKNWHEERSMFFIILAKGQGDKIAEIQKLAQQYGMQLMVAPRPVGTKRAKQARKARKFYDFYQWKIRHKVIQSEPTLETATHYIRAKGPDPHWKLPFKPADDVACAHARKLFPSLAIALNADQVATLEKSGAKNIADAIADELEAFVDSRAFQYFYLTRFDRRWKSALFYRPCISKAVDLMRRDYRFAPLLMPANVRMTKRLERPMQLLELTVYFEREPHRSYRIMELREGLLKKAVKTFEHLLGDLDAVERRLSFLNAINIGHGDVELLLDMVRFAQRRNSKSLMTYGREVDAIKEAA